MTDKAYILLCSGAKPNWHIHGWWASNPSYVDLSLASGIRGKANISNLRSGLEVEQPASGILWKLEVHEGNVMESDAEALDRILQLVANEMAAKTTMAIASFQHDAEAYSYLKTAHQNTSADLKAYLAEACEQRGVVAK